MNKNTWKNIQKWRDYYNSTPNGWAVALLVGSEYENPQSRLSPQKRKKKSGLKKRN